jgi:hypothetical protein
MSETRHLFTQMELEGRDQFSYQIRQGTATRHGWKNRYRCPKCGKVAERLQNVMSGRVLECNGEEFATSRKRRWA